MPLTLSDASGESSVIVRGQKIKLPFSTRPWTMTSDGDEIVLTNPDHPERRVKNDGTVEIKVTGAGVVWKDPE